MTNEEFIQNKIKNGTMPVRVLNASGAWVDSFDTSSGAGYVVGPASSTDYAVVRYNGTTGKLVRDSSVVLDNFGTFQSQELGMSAVDLINLNAGSGLSVGAGNGTLQASGKNVNVYSSEDITLNSTGTTTLNSTGTYINGDSVINMSSSAGPINITSGAPGANGIMINGSSGGGTVVVSGSSSSLSVGPTAKLDSINSTQLNFNGDIMLQADSAGAVRPSGNLGVDLGTTTARWRGLYVGAISGTTSTFTVDNATVVSGTTFSGNSAFFRITANSPIVSGTTINSNTINNRLTVNSNIISGTTVNSNTINNKLTVNSSTISGTTISGNTIYQGTNQVLTSGIGLGNINIIKLPDGILSISGTAFSSQYCSISITNNGTAQPATQNNITIASGTWVERNRSSAFQFTPNPMRITLSGTGYTNIPVSLTANVTNSATGIADITKIYLYKNDTLIPGTDIWANYVIATPDMKVLSTSTIVSMSTNDYVDLRVDINSNTAQTVLYGTINATTLA